ncbi:MAG: DUF6034 family protein [Eubacteriales bacterium]|nr:DUF6034 family protein [Eubacteriales bacterium]
MIQKSIAAFGLVLCVLFSTACQKTPESPIVIGKNSELLIEKATQPDSNPAVDENSSRITGAPKSYRAELTNRQGNLLIHVDAAIEVPDVSAMSVARITPREFTCEDVRLLYDTFCTGATSIGPDPVFTKAFQLRSYQDYLDLRKTNVFPDMQFDSMEEFDAAISKFMQSIDTLPEEFTPAEPDFSFNNHGIANCYAARSSELVSQVSVSDAKGLSSARYYRDVYERNFIDALRSSATDSYSLMQDPRYVPPALDIDAARSIAAEAAASIGLSDYTIAAERETCLWDITSVVPTDTLKGAYEFIFTPAIGGIPCTYADGESNNQDNQRNQYDTAWYYEKVRVIVDDDGLNSVLWDAPFQSIGTITGSASLLPYSQIQSIFERMMPIVFSHYNPADQKTVCHVNISRITLGYLRIKEQNADGSGLIIPVWDYFGSYARSDDPAGTTPQGSGGYESLMTINAIDGSILDRTAGY